MAEMGSPWRSLNQVLLDANNWLPNAIRSAKRIPHHLEAAGFLEHALSAIPDRSPWPSSDVAAGAAKLLAGATGDGLPPLVQSMESALDLADFIQDEDRGLPALLHKLRVLRDSKPRYADIPMDFGGQEVYDSICGNIEPVGRRIRRAIRELRLAEGHLIYIRQLLGEFPWDSATTTTAEAHARQARGCIEDAFLYLTCIEDMLNSESREVWSFFGSDLVHGMIPKQATFSVSILSAKLCYFVLG
jgi:hypothetical protein